MQITDILRETDVVLDIPGTSKPSILAKMSGVVAVSSSHDEAQILHALMAREALGSTGIGGGIGLPHARLPCITAPVSIFARLKTPVDFDAVDGRPVDLAFLLLLPNDARVLQCRRWPVPHVACAIAESCKKSGPRSVAPTSMPQLP
jgi:nitrogen PTS system EIIA component